MKLNYSQRRRIAILSLVIGIVLVVGGMLVTGQVALPSWLQGAIILFGFIITSFGTKLLRCPKCNKFPDKEVMLETGQCSNCNKNEL